MPDIVFSRQQIGTLVASCGQGGVTCMGAGRMLLHLEDFDFSTDPSKNRVWRSGNNGASWSELAKPPGNSAWFYRSYAPARDRVLVGTDGPQGTNGVGGYDPAEDDAVAVTEDGGDSWAAGVDASALFAPAAFDDVWQTRDFVPLDAGEIWAVGSYTRSGASQASILRSIDGGLSFTEFFTDPASSRTILSGAYLGGGVVLLGLEWASDVGMVARSITRGSGWSVGALPLSGTYDGVTTSEVRTICHLGGNVVLAGGKVRTTNGRSARLWRSTNGGQTWTELSSQLPTTTAVTRIVKLSATAAALIMEGAGPYFSLDSGVTWTAATLSEAPLAGYEFVDAAVADNGAVVCLYSSLLGGAVYVSRGVLQDITGAGPCQSALFQSPSLPVIGEGGCVVTHRRRSGACIDTLNDDDIIRGKWQAGDRLIINRVIFSIDWDYRTSLFTKHVVYTFGDSARKYGLRPAMRIESKGIRSTPTPCGGFGSVGCGIDMLDERAFNLGARFADPPPMLNLEIFYRKHTWEPGDIICVTSAFVPNVVSGQRGIVDEAFEVINIQQQFAPEGKIILTLLDVEAITLPTDPQRSIAEDEVSLLARLREQEERLTEIPPTVELLHLQRREVALFRRGKTQEGIPPTPAPARRREVLAGLSRGTFPGVP